MNAFQCSRCHATDQQVACIRHGARNRRSWFEYLCIDQAGCDFRKAALVEPPRMTLKERFAQNRIDWEAKQTRMAARS